MNIISDLIGELLIQHNCVVVPSFGGFVAKQTSASIDYQAGTMIPPRKSLLFNRQLINNDGLLISALAHRNQMAYEKAQEEVNETVKTWQRQLHAGERVVLDQVGYLFLDAEKNIGFEQDRHVNLLLEAFGLGKVHFIAEEDLSLLPIQPKETPVIQLNTALPIENELVTEGAPIVEHPAVSRSRAWRYMAAVALAPVAFYSYWIPMKTRVLESGVFAIQDFNPFQTSADGNYHSNTWSFDWQTIPNVETLDDMLKQVESDATTFSYPFDEDLYIPIRLQETTTEIQSTQESSKIDAVETTMQSGKFFLIVGWFSTQSNADELVQNLKKNGLQAEVFPHANGFRVSAARNSSADFSSIQSKLTELKLTGWVLKK